MVGVFHVHCGFFGRIGNQYSGFVSADGEVQMALLFEQVFCHRSGIDMEFFGQSVDYVCIGDNASNIANVLRNHLFSIQSSHPLLQIPLRAGCRCLANLVALGNKDVLGEGAHIVSLKQKDVVAKV